MPSFINKYDSVINITFHILTYFFFIKSKIFCINSKQQKQQQQFKTKDMHGYKYVNYVVLS